MSKTLEILYKNSFWLAINKPAGVSVHNGTEESPDVLTILGAQLEASIKSLHPLHRLDQEASGVMLIGLGLDVSVGVGGGRAGQPHSRANKPNSMPNFETDSIHKKYIAVLRGKLEGSENLNSNSPGIWDWPLTNRAEGRSDPQGQKVSQVPAKSLYKVLQMNDYFTKVEIVIETGRTHQIRRHSALAKHPVVGDRRYDTDKYCDLIFEKYKTPRLFLHAQSLTLEWQGQTLTIEANTPTEFYKLMNLS